MSTLYPPLNDSNKTESFRLNEIAEIRRKLEKERDFRRSMYKKYVRGVNALVAADVGLATASLGFGLTGLFVPPLLIPFEAVAGTCGVLGVISTFIIKKLQSKADKHNKIRAVAESKINTITDHISKALSDNQISDEEFHLILSELEKYNAMKADIQSKTKKQPVVSEEEKKALIQKGKDLAMSALRKKLDDEHNST